jgi:hypothetical protein
VLSRFDAGQLDLVVFGGMVRPGIREHLREQVSARNPGAAFVQGYAGSTSRVILDEELPAGAHAIAIPAEVPAQASFATVSAGPSVHAFIVGPMPDGTTLARFPSRP